MKIAQLVFKEIHFADTVPHDGPISSCPMCQDKEYGARKIRESKILSPRIVIAALFILIGLAFMFSRS